MISSRERPTYAFEGFRLDAQHRALSRAGGEPILLPPKVFDTLLYFVEHWGELLDKRALLEAIWPNVVVEENNLNQCISTLRRVLGERAGEHRFIVTEPGRGYRFVATVTTVANQKAEGGPADATVAMGRGQAGTRLRKASSTPRLCRGCAAGCGRARAYVELAVGEDA